jgi:hypothetical protein
VAYTPDWVPLADALKRVMATGVSEAEAKADLCNALADKKIDVRVRISKSDRARGGEVYSDGNVGVPSHLAPTDFDWKLSSPFAPWSIGPRLGEHYFWSGGWEKRPIDLIELLTANVIDELVAGAGAKQVQMADQTTMVAQPNADTENQGARSRKGSRTKREADRAAQALKVLYPNGAIPGQDSVSNKVLLNEVNDLLKKMMPPLEPVKMDSMQRAAKRRK